MAARSTARAASIGIAPGVPAPASVSSMMTPRSSRMLLGKLREQHVVEVLAGLFRRRAANGLASSCPAIAACRSGTLAGLAHVVIRHDGEAANVIENRKGCHAACIDHRPRWSRAELHASEAGLDTLADREVAAIGTAEPDSAAALGAERQPCAGLVAVQRQFTAMDGDRLARDDVL